MRWMRIGVWLAVLSLVGTSHGQAPNSPSAIPGLAMVDQVTDFPLLDRAIDTLDFSTESHGWIVGEYWLGWVHGQRLPALLTTSPDGTDAATAGILGQATTSVLFNDRVNSDVRSGFRLAGGYLYDREHGLGVEAGVSYLGSQSTTLLASSDDFAILARPYTDATTGDPEAVLAAFPGTSTGSVEFTANSGDFFETHVGLTERIWSTDSANAGVILGYRFNHYDDGLRMRQTILATDTQIDSTDDFAARNNFHGLDMGMRAEMTWRRLTWNLLGKVAVGHLQSTVKINGRQVTSVTGSAPDTQTGGVYALASNIGTYHDGEWTLQPELGSTLSWQLRPNLSLRLGYSAMFLNDFAVAANQIDRTINPALFPPADLSADPLRPLFQLSRSDLWIHSFNLGVDYRF